MSAVATLTDDQLVSELNRIHYELIERLSNHYLYGAGFPDDGEGDVPQPERLEKARALGALLDTMVDQFREGGIPHPDGIDHLVGLDHYRHEIAKWSTRLACQEASGAVGGGE